MCMTSRGRLALAVLSAILLAAGADEAQAQSGRVFGRIVDAETGRPVRGVTVTVANPEAAPSSFTTVTGDNGRFSMLGLRSGVWDVSAKAPGYYDAAGQTRVQQSVARAAALEFRMRKLPPPIVSAFAEINIGTLEQELLDAQSLLEQGRPDEAIAAYTALLEKAPGLTSIHLQLGQAHRLKNEFDTAIAAYEQIPESDSRRHLAQVEIALTELERGDLAAAERVLAAASEAENVDPEVYYSLGEVKLAGADPAGAALWYEKAQAAAPAWTRPLVGLGVVAMLQEDVATAAAYLERAIALDPAGSDADEARALLQKIRP